MTEDHDVIHLGYCIILLNENKQGGYMIYSNMNKQSIKTTMYNIHNTSMIDNTNKKPIYTGTLITVVGGRETYLLLLESQLTSHTHE